MPSDLPKVTAYLSPEAYEALDAAAQALGRSRSRLVGDLVDASIPMLEVITDAALVVKNADAAQKQALAQAAEELAPLQGQANSLVADVIGVIGKAAGVDPRPSNTGVRNP